MRVCADEVLLNGVAHIVFETKKETSGYIFLVDLGGGRQWLEESDVEEVLFECDNCDEPHWIESGTWALDRGLCYSCNNAHEGGDSN